MGTNKGFLVEGVELMFVARQRMFRAYSVVSMT